MSKDDQLINELLNTETELTDKQRNIIEAATEIFAEKGYAATSTKEIAQKAGVAEGTIFRHYKTKKDLLMSIVTPMMIKMLAPVIIKDLNKVLLQEFEEFEDFLRAMIDNRAKFLKKNLSTMRILIQEIPFQQELKEQFIEHVGSKVFSRLRQIVEYYQKKGQLVDMHPDTLIRFAGSAIIGHFATKYVIDSPNYEEEIELERTIQLLKNALSPK